jgi:succinate-semialdehyde dehydrogenase/glutarate-semialdehyde dehydrogenase
VFDDADLDLALQALLFSKFRNAGQVCIASNRILVQAGVYDKFAAMVAAAAKGLHCGTVHSGGSLPITTTAGVTPTVGPLIDGRAISKVRATSYFACGDHPDRACAGNR